MSEKWPVFASESHPRAKLTRAQVTEMRRLRRERGLTFGQLGLRFGVSRSNACRICNGKRWGKGSIGNAN